MPQMMPAPWRILLLDRDPDDPKWILATVAIGSDVVPAGLSPDGGYTGWTAIASWVRNQAGDAGLVPLQGVCAWVVVPDPGRE